MGVFLQNYLRRGKENISVYISGFDNHDCNSQDPHRSRPSSEYLVDENVYPSREAALEDAIRFLVAMKGKLYNRIEIQEILSRHITVPSDKILQDVRQEEEL